MKVIRKALGIVLMLSWLFMLGFISYDWLTNQPTAKLVWDITYMTFVLWLPKMGEGIAAGYKIFKDDD